MQKYWQADPTGFLIISVCLVLSLGIFGNVIYKEIRTKSCSVETVSEVNKLYYFPCTGKKFDKKLEEFLKEKKEPPLKVFHAYASEGYYLALKTE